MKLKFESTQAFQAFSGNPEQGKQHPVSLL
jgi:hypothetical protein